MPPTSPEVRDPGPPNSSRLVAPNSAPPAAGPGWKVAGEEGLVRHNFPLFPAHLVCHRSLVAASGNGNTATDHSRVPREIHVAPASRQVPKQVGTSWLGVFLRKSIRSRLTGAGWKPRACESTPCTLSSARARGGARETSGLRQMKGRLTSSSWAAPFDVSH